MQMVLVVQHESIDQKVYVQCLVDYYLPWTEKESEKTNIDYILQEDNAPCHVGAYSRWFKIKTMTNTLIDGHHRVRLKMSGLS